MVLLSIKLLTIHKHFEFLPVQLDFWHPDSAPHIVTQMQVDFHVSAHQSRSVQILMEQNEIQYEILLHNLQEEIEKQFDGKRNFTGRHSYTKYNDWDKIAAWTARIAKIYPKLVSRIQIGNTFEKQPMYLLKVGKESGRKKAIFMDCGIHAREWISPAFCQWFVKQAARTYGKDKIMTHLLDSLNFYVLPVFNIDGYVWSWTQDRMWRKNRSKNSSTNCTGTDLNRNFAAAWGTTGFISDDPCDETYYGPAPESEDETKAVATFIRNHLSSIKAYLTIHAYSQMLLFPYGYTFHKAPNHNELVKPRYIELALIHQSAQPRPPGALLYRVLSKFVLYQGRSVLRSTYHCVFTVVSRQLTLPRLLHLCFSLRWSPGVNGRALGN
uniref:Carboxypeptidase A3 n=1 Tax=Terrapene triunguis TaxID=2587831 RepID=A0A674K2F7_9SAUR